jgi:hypothetical protein
MGMTEERIAASITIDAAAETVFDVLADPAAHVAIGRGGGVRHAVDSEHLTGTGQVFRMAMYHEGHPNKNYEMANRVEVFDRPRAIAWQPGAEPRHVPGRENEDGPVEWGGWVWRYDLEAVTADRTEVTLSYDWSQVPPENRDIEFPPFGPEHLDTSLKKLAELAERA